MPWIAEDSWNSSYQPLKHWHFFVQHFLEHYICIQTNLPHWMFPDLCWGSFNYNTYKANISLFPKWIHKILSHVMFPCLSYTFYPPKHSESILFRYHLGGCQPTKGFFTYQQGSRTWTLSQHDYDLMSLIWHMYFPMVGMIHDTNFFEFVEVTPTFCNTIRVS